MITVLGSINVDLTFRVPHLPDVGETVLTPGFSEAVGGKGANQAIAAARDGAATRFIGCCGEDAFGATARSLLIDAGVDATGLETLQGVATGLASILVDGEGRNKIAVASGANGKVEARALDARLAPGSQLVLQMEIPAAEVEAAIAHAKRAGAHVLLNLAPALPLPLAALRQVDTLVVNEHEASTLCGELGLAAAEPEAQARALSRMLGTTVIITLGVAGAIAFHRGILLCAPALPVKAIDSTGAGDCFVGVLAAGLTRGLDLPAAMRRACAAGSLACAIVGAAPSFPTARQIDAALAEYGGRP
jgi:ribokinase